MSPQRGKTWGQVLEAMAAARGVADDKEVQALDITASVKRVNGLSAAVKDLLERKLPVWTFRTAKSEEWQKLLNEAEQAMEQLKEGAEEIIDMVSAVKDPAATSPRRAMEGVVQKERKRCRPAGGTGHGLCVCGAVQCCRSRGQGPQWTRW
jgi:hypothetical protein